MHLPISSHSIFFYTKYFLSTPIHFHSLRRMSSSSSSSSSSSKCVKVSSYNVLSSALADPNFFTHCERKYLRADYRVNKLQTKLRKEMQSNSIICLQEVSKVWSNQLETFFTSQGYRYIPGLYGSPFTGNMGVAIAVPTSLYEIEEIDIACVANTKPKVQPPPLEPSTPESECRSILRSLCDYIFGSSSCSSADEKPSSSSSKEEAITDSVTAALWDEILVRKNLMICLRLSHKLHHNHDDNNNPSETMMKSPSFVVGTYHMPCAYQTPAVMVAHTALSTQHIQHFARSDPYIYVGDYNFLPSSSQYMLMTTGTIDPQVHQLSVILFHRLINLSFLCISIRTILLMYQMIIGLLVCRNLCLAPT
jgi:hypothetical protein